jgi:CxxC motif-containing protein (DUF1111 family)
VRVLVVAALVACGSRHRAIDMRPGGDITVADRTKTAYTHAAPGLTTDQVGKHIAGQGQFNFEWESPLLGPEFNNTHCIGCHAGDGRGESQIGTGSASQALLRVSLGSGTPMFPGGPVPVPSFGLQLHDHAIDAVQQVNITQRWTDKPGAFGDGTAFTLRKPDLDVRLPDGSEFRPDALRSYRQAPAVFGLGLLEAVPAAAIIALADPSVIKPDGIRGVANMVWSVEQKKPMLGRFGQKANVPTIVEQVAGAFRNDIGLTNPFFPEANGNTEIGGDALTNVMFFVATEGVPAPAPLEGDAGHGSELFEQYHCSVCHVTTLVTGDSPLAVLANQTIHPYTDMLVHQMGSGLADGRPDFLADGQSFRTTPLWGLGLVQVVSPQATFLHDGRARTIEEAILWHGGEADAAKEAYRNASRADRAALIDFLSSL